MREIKFRAWDKNNKGFINGFNMLGYSSGQGAPKRKLQRFSDEWTAEDVVLMQYTGLKDKNGVEIYEGDTIKYKELIPSENKIQKIIQGADYVYLEFVGKVVWDDEGASFDVDGGNHGYRGFGARGSVEYEVIGNIFENSDMLPKDEPMITWCEHGKMLVCEECAKRPPSDSINLA